MTKGENQQLIDEKKALYESWIRTGVMSRQEAKDKLRDFRESLKQI